MISPFSKVVISLIKDFSNSFNNLFSFDKVTFLRIRFILNSLLTKSQIAFGIKCFDVCVGIILSFHMFRI